MNRLFIELYFDEDVSVLIAEWLRVRGFKVQITHEAGRKSMSDEEQLAYAVSQRRTLLTHTATTSLGWLNNTLLLDTSTTESSSLCAALRVRPRHD